MVTRELRHTGQGCMEGIVLMNCQFTRRTSMVELLTEDKFDLMHLANHVVRHSLFDCVFMISLIYGNIFC